MDRIYIFLLTCILKMVDTGARIKEIPNSRSRMNNQEDEDHTNTLSSLSSRLPHTHPSTVSIGDTSTLFTTESEPSLQPDIVAMETMSTSRKRPQTSSDCILKLDEDSNERLNNSTGSEDVGCLSVRLITPNKQTIPEDENDPKKARMTSNSKQGKSKLTEPSLAPRNVDTIEHEDRDIVRIRPASPMCYLSSNAMKEYIVRKASNALKKLPHKKGSHPITEFTEYLANEAAALKLFEGVESTCRTPQLIRWELTSNEEINSWLGKKDQYIHPVEDGEWFIEWGTVYNPLYAWAKFHSCEVTFDKTSNCLTFTFRSELFATGRDENGMLFSIQ